MLSVLPKVVLFQFHLHSFLFNTFLSKFHKAKQMVHKQGCLNVLVRKGLKTVMLAFVLQGYLSFSRKQQISHLTKTKHRLRSVFQPESHKYFLAAAIFTSASDQTAGKLQ